MPWEIQYYSETVRQDIEVWPVGIRAVYARITERMQVFGPHLGMPFTRPLGAGLFEVRAKGKEGIGRAFFCTTVGHTIVILHAFIKKSQKNLVETLSLPGDGCERCAMKTHDDMIATWKQDPTFCMEYDALEETFTFFDALVSARHQAGLTQADVAEHMGTKTPAVARLEAGGGRQHHAPSLTTLRKYAAAVGCRLEIKLVPLSPSARQERGPTEQPRKSFGDVEREAMQRLENELNRHAELTRLIFRLMANFGERQVTAEPGARK